MSIEGREYRDALGRFATGVCLITTTTADGRHLALTANSFSSVSLDPPLVLWNLQDNSDVFDEYASPERYAINILSQEQMDLSNTYAKKGGHELAPAHFTIGEHGAPVISGALASFECEPYATHEGGDHVIIVGRVMGMSSSGEGRPLLFFGGSYGELAT